MDNNELIKLLLKAEADNVTSRGVNIPFEVTNDTMLPDGVKIDSITINPLYAGTLFRIKPYLLKIPSKDMKKMSCTKERDYDPDAPELFEKYAETVLDILTIAIHNHQSEPPPWYKSFLKENCTWEDIHILLNCVLYRLGTQSFYKSTIASMSMGPLDGKEITAFSKNIRTWKSKNHIHRSTW